MSVVMVIIIVAVVMGVCGMVYYQHASSHRAMVAPATNTVVMTTPNQNYTPQMPPAFNPSAAAGYGGYITTAPPSYPTTTGYLTTGYPNTGYLTTGYLTASYPDAPPPYPS